jgi:hypothetical protein
VRYAIGTKKTQNANDSPRKPVNPLGQLRTGHFIHLQLENTGCSINQPARLTYIKGRQVDKSELLFCQPPLLPARQLSQVGCDHQVNRRVCTQRRRRLYQLPKPTAAEPASLTIKNEQRWPAGIQPWPQSIAQGCTCQKPEVRACFVDAVGTQ